MLFFQIFPRYPCFYSFMPKNNTPIFIYFLERSFKHSFLFSKFIDPILFDTFYTVDPKNFNFEKEFQAEIISTDNKLADLHNTCKEKFKSAQSHFLKLYTYLPINLIQKFEMINVYCKNIFNHIDKIIQMFEQNSPKNNNPSTIKSENMLLKGSIEFETELWNSLKILHNISISIFMICKLKNFFKFFIDFGFADIVTDCFEFLALELSKNHHFKKEFILKLLNFSVFQRRSEIIEITNQKLFKDLNDFKKNHIKEQNILIKNKLFPFVSSTSLKQENILFMTLLNKKLDSKQASESSNILTKNSNSDPNKAMTLIEIKSIIMKALNPRNLNLNYKSKNDSLKVPYTFKVSNKNQMFHLKDDHSDKQNYILTTSQMKYGFSDDLGQLKLYRNK